MNVKRLLLSLLVVAVFVALHTVIVYANDSTQTKSEASATGTVEPGLRSETEGSKTDDIPDAEAMERLKQAISQRGEKIQFQAEINQLLGIIINSLYTNKEIFLRELISNASDALDKIRFISLTDKAALSTNEKLEIRIRAYPERNQLVIKDTGIGMTKQDLINNLGTIARSGTKAFLEKLQKSQESVNLIGQFGVGFYSAFLVADTVTVITKHNDDKQYIWESRADNAFSIVEDPRGDTLGRGTEMILHLKDDADAKVMLNETHLAELIGKYSEFIQFPIYLHTSRNVTETITEKKEEKPEEKKEEKTDEKKEEEKIDIEDVKDEKKPETETTRNVTRTVYEWKLMNQNKPIWTRNPKNVTNEEYINFYKALSKADPREPLSWIHFTGEGQVDFKAILYIPESEQTMFDFSEKRSNIRLYVKRVFITDSIADLMPRYMSFVRGIVDSDDLPLHVSRELLQHSKLLRLIKSKLVTKMISLFKQLADKEQKARKMFTEKVTEEEKKAAQDDISKWKTFWTYYGKAVKLGIMEDSENRQRLIKILRFKSNKSEFDDTSLDEYISRMKDKQKSIYYIAGESQEDLRKSPFLEETRKRDLEVLYFVDPIDEYMVQQIKEYEGKDLQSIAREDVKFGDETDDQKKKEEELKKEFEPLTTYFKDELKRAVVKVSVGTRFTGPDQSPCVVSALQHGYTANMYRIMRAQTLGNDQEKIVKMFENAKNLEINPHHPVVIDLNKKIKHNKEDPTAKSIARLLFDTALLRSGYQIDDSAAFADHILDVMRAGLKPNTESASQSEPTQQQQQQQQQQQHTSSVKDEL